MTMLTDQVLAECDEFSEKWAKQEAEAFGGVIGMLTGEIRRLRMEVSVLKAERDGLVAGIAKFRTEHDPFRGLGGEPDGLWPPVGMAPEMVEAAMDEMGLPEAVRGLIRSGTRVRVQIESGMPERFTFTEPPDRETP